MLTLTFHTSNYGLLYYISNKNLIYLLNNLLYVIVHQRQSAFNYSIYDFLKLIRILYLERQSSSSSNIGWEQKVNICLKSESTLQVDLKTGILKDKTVDVTIN